jgi:hypothetical protein
LIGFAIVGQSVGMHELARLGHAHGQRTQRQ